MGSFIKYAKNIWFFAYLIRSGIMGKFPVKNIWLWDLDTHGSLNQEIRYRFKDSLPDNTGFNTIVRACNNLEIFKDYMFQQSVKASAKCPIKLIRLE